MCKGPRFPNDERSASSGLAESVLDWAVSAQGPFDARVVVPVDISKAPSRNDQSRLSQSWQSSVFALSRQSPLRDINRVAPTPSRMKRTTASDAATPCPNAAAERTSFIRSSRPGASREPSSCPGTSIWNTLLSRRRRDAPFNRKFRRPLRLNTIAAYSYALALGSCAT